jgi:NAD(P)-dependent dehydrogenase (short-subunit alcohol dehydrogenase family)
MAKAALNQLTVTLANDFKKSGHPIGIVAFQPGYIKTKLTGYKGPIDINESVTGMVNLAETVTPEGSPYFLSWKGETLPW